MADEPSRRSRSRSPSRRGPRQNRGGFRWKDTSRRNDNNDRNDRHDRGDSDRRDFRDRSPGRYRRDDYRDRGRNRDGDRDRNRGGRDGDRDGERGRDRDRDREFHRDKERLRTPRRDERDARGRGDQEKKEKKEKKSKAPPPVPAGGGEEMIVVNVNDRLGSKSAVPCLPSDTVGQFKIMVAARIGREPSQIMLRRQGERPFKDHITLEDYGISNGVQLDLEIDTGD